MQLTARLHTNRWRPATSYDFREEARGYWENVWRAADGDLAELVRWAEQTKIGQPGDFVLELHRFLFGIYPGIGWLQRYPKDGIPAHAARGVPSSFLDYLRKLAEEHDSDPFPREWYTWRGVTHGEFVQYLRLEGAPDDASESSVVAEVNAHIPHFGTHLLEAYYLMRHPAMEGQVDNVRANLERIAQRAEADHDARMMMSVGRPLGLAIGGAASDECDTCGHEHGEGGCLECAEEQGICRPLGLISDTGFTVERAGV